MNDQIGIFTGIPFDEYQKIDALNGSAIVHMRKSPMHYRYTADNPQPPTEAMILGTATHQLILEPDRVGDFAVWGEQESEKVRRGQVWEAFKAMHAGKLIVTKAQRDSMIGMAVAARKNVPVMKYANLKGETEVVMVWDDKVYGRRMKGRIDKLIAKGHVIFDLKTTRDCGKYRFGGQAYTLGYHIKMAIYASGYRTLTNHEPKMVLGAIESKAPHESAVYRITTDILLQGYDDLNVLMKKLADCEATNSWPGAEPDELELTFPTYAYTEQSTEYDMSDLALVDE
jgi:hypothetical protein